MSEQQQKKIRLLHIESKLMEAELLLDGLFTHNNFKHCMNPIHAERIGLALGAVRSARNTLRADNKSRQLTLFTRGKKYNRGGVNWLFNAVPQWKCDCKMPFVKKHVWTPKGRIKPKDVMQSALPIL